MRDSLQVQGSLQAHASPQLQSEPQRQFAAGAVAWPWQPQVQDAPAQDWQRQVVALMVMIRSAK